MLTSYIGKENCIFFLQFTGNSHERTMTKIKAQQRQIKKQLHLLLKRCENNVSWRELCFASLPLQHREC